MPVAVNEAVPPRIGWEKLGVRAHNRAIVVDCACHCFSGPGIVERDRVAVAEALKAVCVSRGVCVGTDRGALAIGSPDCEFVVSCAPIVIVNGVKVEPCNVNGVPFMLPKANCPPATPIVTPPFVRSVKKVSVELCR